MPIEYTVHEGGFFVHAVATGTITPEQVLEYERATAEDDRIKFGFRELFDESLVEKSTIDHSDMEVIAAQVMSSPKRQATKLAIVPGQGAAFERAQLLEKLVHLSRGNIIVFDNPTTAKQWLGVVDDDQS